MVSRQKAEATAGTGSLKIDRQNSLTDELICLGSLAADPFFLHTLLEGELDFRTFVAHLHIFFSLCKFQPGLLICTADGVCIVCYGLHVSALKVLFEWWIVIPLPLPYGGCWSCL